MGVPTSEVGYTSATRMGDHEVYMDMWWHWNIYIYIYMYIYMSFTIVVRALSRSVNTSDFLSPVSFVVCQVRPFTSFLSVFRFQQSLSLRFYSSPYIVSFYALRYFLPHFLFLQHFTCPLTFCNPCHSIFVSPIFLANSFLRLLSLSIALVVFVSPSRQFSHQQTTIR
jgi:hypothetical protein